LQTLHDSQNGANIVLSLPNPKNWKKWEYEDYLRYFLSYKSAKKRLRGKGFPLDMLSRGDIKEFLKPIKNRIREKFENENPEVSISLPAYNEEDQIIPTLISYTLTECEYGVAELVVVDNGSDDRTREIAEECGVKLVKCRKKGLHYARDAGLKSAHDDAEYIWMSDSDVRVVPPIKRKEDLHRKGTTLRTSYEYLESNPKVAGVSTGVVIESSHWFYKITHGLALALGMTNKYSCWSGGNQFMRKWALEESGGINLEMGGASEDHIRHYQLARWAKENDMQLHSANMDESLADPVYHSGRRVGSAKGVLESIWSSVTRSNLEKGEHWSDTRHTKGDWWTEMDKKKN
jgi:hypothetical protein